MKILIVDDINSGKVINTIYATWNRIKSEKDQAQFNKTVASTFFGTYNQYSILDLLERFNVRHGILQDAFIQEVQRAYEEVEKV